MTKVLKLGCRVSLHISGSPTVQRGADWRGVWSRGVVGGVQKRGGVSARVM